MALPDTHLLVVGSQQPAQVAGLHTHIPPWHCSPAGQLMQAVPLVPQNSFEVPGLQVWVASSQQPLEQLRVVHTQVPFWHSVPGGH